MSEHNKATGVVHGLTSPPALLAGITDLEQCRSLPSDANSPSGAEQSRPARILVVEDEAIVAMDLAEQLEEMGYISCGIADNAADALILAEQQRPDLVMMDVVIKGPRDGIETAHELFDRFQVPVIFLTAYSDTVTVDRAVRTSPYGYLTKPYQAREVRAVIEVALVKSGLERRLRESEYWLTQTLSCVADGVLATDFHGRLRFINPQACTLLGWAPERAIGLPLEQVVRFVDLPGAAMPPDYQIHPDIAHRNTSAFGVTVQTADGKLVMVDCSCAAILDPEGRVQGCVMAIRSVEGRHRAERALRESEARFRSAFRHAPAGMLIEGPDGIVLQANAAMSELTGLPVESMLQMRHEQLCEPDEASREFIARDDVRCGRKARGRFEKRLRTDQGPGRWVSVTISLHGEPGDEQAPSFLYQYQDLTELKASEARLQQLTHFDPLTGLLNRTRMLAQFEELLRDATQSGESMAIVFLDVDRFKHVNDSLGHEVGDQLLQLVAQRLQSLIHPTDYLARLGGDEFAMLLPGRRAEDLPPLLDVMRERLASPVVLGGEDIAISVSMGASLFPNDGSDVTALVRGADAAMYHAKAMGRNNLQFYRPEMTRVASDRLRMESALANALAQGEFEVHYQPILRAADGTLFGAEALVRWRRPGDGMISPAAFIPVAEDTGMIVPIGEFVLRSACHEAVSWSGNWQVAVNISTRQMARPEFLETVRDALQTTGLAPSRLCLEITEELLLDNTEHNLQLIASLKQMGVRIAVDDFGIGYSSLSYLKRFSPHKLKIDRSFVRDLMDDPDDAAIVSAVLAMARSLGIAVVAEGVELDAQREHLQNAGCDFLQGFLFSKAMPAEEFRRWVQSRLS